MLKNKPKGGLKVIILNVEKILKEQGHTKSWLCNEMDITLYNLNKAIKCGKKSISYKYLERILQSIKLFI